MCFIAETIRVNYTFECEIAECFGIFAHDYSCMHVVHTAFCG